MHQNIGDLAIDQSTSIPSVAALTRSGWVTLSDQATSQVSPAMNTEQLATLDSGRATDANELTSAGNGTVITTRTGAVFQKQHSQWWRLTATWTGECSAVPIDDLIADAPTLRWAAPADVRA